MEKRRGKISSREIFFILLVIIYSPAVRLFAHHAANIVGKAGWLVPIVAVPAYLFLVNQIHYMLNKYPGLSLLQVYEKIVGKLLAKIITGIYLLWIIILLAFYLSSYAERLITSVYPNIIPAVFIISLLVVVAMVVRSGLVISSRMIQIFLWLITISFGLIFVILIPKISIDKIYPVTYFDIMPIFRCSIIIIGILSYITFIAILSDNIKDVEKFKKMGMRSGIFSFVVITLLIISSIGTIGEFALSHTHYSFLMTVGRIVLLNDLTGFESTLVATWILSDFAIPVIFTLVAMRMMKYLFNIQDTSLYTNIFLILIYFVTVFLSKSIYSLTEFSTNFALNVNLILCFILPIVMSWLLKLKTKGKEMIAKERKKTE